MQEPSKRKRGRGFGPRLNDLQRLEILRRHRSSSPPVSIRQLARDFHVDEKTVRRVVAAASDIEARASASAVLSLRGQVHRRPSARFPELEKTLAAWIDARQRARAEISPSVVIDKAKLLARAMGIRPEDFKASWGWYDKFSRRYGIRTAFVGAETQHQERHTRQINSLQELHALMGQYDPEWVFTVEETSLLYDALPFEAAAGHDAEEKKRVTLVVSCNSTGRLMLPVCMVGKQQQPGEAAASSSPVPYFTQQRAWLDRATFGSWYHSVFAPFVRERTQRPVLLVVDSERPGHQGDFEDAGIRLVFLPPSPAARQSSPESVEAAATASDPRAWWSRPLRMGVLSALKMKYKYLLVQSALSFYNAPEEVKAVLKAAEEREESHCGGVHFGHAPTLLDAARVLSQAWSQVPADLLESCFALANMVPPSKLLASPASMEGMRIQASSRYSEAIASQVEEMLVSSSLPASAWPRSEQRPPSNLRDRIRAFLLVDSDDSVELQRQLREEISAALSDVAPSRPASASAALAPSVGAGTSASCDPAPSRGSLKAEVREVLVGITEVATRLRLLPRHGVDAEKLAPLQLEGCIAAADQIRQCVQTFDSSLRADTSQEEQARSSAEASTEQQAGAPPAQATSV
jgi:hypothetical protein